MASRGHQRTRDERAQRKAVHSEHGQPEPQLKSKESERTELVSLSTPPPPLPPPPCLITSICISLPYS